MIENIIYTYRNLHVHCQMIQHCFGTKQLKNDTASKNFASICVKLCNMYGHTEFLLRQSHIYDCLCSAFFWSNIALFGTYVCVNNYICMHIRTHIILYFTCICKYGNTCVTSFSEAIEPYDDISDHHYYDNCTQYSYYCSYYCSIVIIITTIYINE